MRPVKDFIGFDLNAPRYQTPVLDILRRMRPVSSFYKKLKQMYPHLKKYSDAEIRKYIIGFNKHIAEVCTDYIDGVVLPEHTGTVMVCTVCSKAQYIDLIASNKAGKRVHYNNMHSDGYIGAVHYGTAYPKVTDYGNSHNFRHMYDNWQFWAFKPCRRFARLVSQAYKTDWKKYRVKTRSYRIEKLIDDDRKKRINKEITKKYKKGYDEFKFD